MDSPLASTTSSDPGRRPAGLRGAGGRSLALLAAAVLLPCCSNPGNQPTLSAVTVRVSVQASGAEADPGTAGTTAPALGSSSPSISADGRYVTFISTSDNLTPATANGKANLYLKDRLTGAVTNITDLVSGEFGPFPEDCLSPAISGDGSTIAFLSTGTFTLGAFGPGTFENVWTYNVATGTFGCPTGNAVTLPNQDCFSPALSQDGRYLTFSTAATNITSTAFSSPAVPFSNPSNVSQVYVVDLLAPNTVPAITLASPASGLPTTGGNGDSAGQSISPDGSVVAFSSSATNLIAGAPAQGVYTSTVPGATITLVSLGIDKTLLTVKPGTGTFFGTAVSMNGRYVLFSGDITNWAAGFAVYRYDPTAGQAFAVGPDLSSTIGFAIISDRIGITYDGQTIVYMNGFTSVAVRNLATNTLQIASVNISGQLANLQCWEPAISGDGSWAVWYTAADNLVASDTNGCSDVFVRGPLN